MTTTFERFWQKVSIRTADECWPWLAAHDANGYGRFAFRGRIALSHRAAWEMSVGPIPETDSAHGTCVLHRCDNPSCVNPSHLMLGSQRDNMEDMRTKGRKGKNQHAAKTHCKQGHEFTPDNIRWTALGRHCRICGDRWARVSMEARKGEKRLDNPHATPVGACRKGHERTPQTSKHYPSPWGGYWHCLICARETKRKWIEKNGRKKSVAGEGLK